MYAKCRISVTLSLFPIMWWISVYDKPKLDIDIVRFHILRQRWKRKSSIILLYTDWSWRTLCISVWLLSSSLDMTSFSACAGVAFILAGPTSPKWDGPVSPPFKWYGPVDPPFKWYGPVDPPFEWDGLVSPPPFSLTQFFPTGPQHAKWYNLMTGRHRCNCTCFMFYSQLFSLFSVKFISAINTFLYHFRPIFWHLLVHKIRLY